MSLEVGKLVARLELEGSFASELSKARADLESTASAAKDLDKALEVAGRAGKNLTVSKDATKSLDTSAKSAKDLGEALDTAGKKGKNLDVSSTAEAKLVKLQSTTRDYGIALKSAADAGKSLDVSDTASGKLTRMQSSARDLDGALQKASNTGRSLDVNDAATGKLASMSSTADQLSAKLESAGLSMSSLMGAAAGGTAVGAVLTKGWDRFTAIDDAQKKLTGLGHETQAVAGIMDSALTSVRGTAYGLGDAATISASAVAAGIKPGKDLTKYLTMTGDAAAIAGVDLSQMGRIINQVQTAQVAYTGDLNQLADRGLPVYQWLAEEAGVTGAEIKKMASTGQISSEMLFNAIQKNIGGAAKTMGDSVTGSISNVGAAIGRLGESIISPFKGAITGVMAGVTTLADEISGGLGPAFSLVGSAVSGAVSVFASLPGPVQAATAALVALQISGVRALVTTMGAGLVSAFTAARAGMVVFAQAVSAQVAVMRSAIATNGIMSASMTGLGTAAAGAGTAIRSAAVAVGGFLKAMAPMAGIAATVGVIAMFVERSRAAASGAEAHAAAVKAGAEAQRELYGALSATNGVMDEQAQTFANSVVQSEIDKVSASAQQAESTMNGLGRALFGAGLGYSDYAAKAADAGSASAEQNARSEMARMEMEALKAACESTGIAVEDAASVAAQGGAKWDQLRAALMSSGDEGAAMVGKLEAGVAAIEATARAAEAATDGAYALGEAFGVMADETAGAEEKAKALMSALDQLNGGTMAADDAIQAHNDSIRDLVDSLSEGVDPAKGFGDALYDAGNRIDTTTENGSKLRDALKGMTEDMVQVAASGGDLAGAWERNEQGLQALADAYGIPLPKMRELAAEMGLIPDVINTAYALEGADAATQEMAALNYLIQNSPDGEVVIGKDQIAESRGLLEELGFEVTSLPDGNVRVEAESESAQVELQGIMNIANQVGSMEEAVTIWTNANVTAEEIRAAGFEATVLPDGSIDVSTNSADEIAKMQSLGFNVNMLPDGYIQITDTSDENIARINNLGIQTVTLPDGRVIVTDTSDENIARLNGLGVKTTTLPPGRVNVSDNVPEVRTRLDSLKTNTSNTHTTYINVVRNFSTTDSAGVQVGHHYGADGGFLPVQSFAAGGLSTAKGQGNVGVPSEFLPNVATIAAPQGARGIVQWAEQETEGEAFIPLAKSKRRRSRDIWIETGKRLGLLEGKQGDIGGLIAGHINKFADGGVMAGGLIDFARGLEGKPYVWGGVNWGDCSGAMSALANWVAGRPPFGSRFATGNQREALAERGFVPGRGAAGDFQIGWFNGGPYGGHTAGTLPDGTNVEMGGGRGNGQFGGPAAGANDPQFTDHAHFPMERFADIDEALGDGVFDSLRGQVMAGQGDPANMAIKPDTRTTRQKNIDAIVAEGQRRNLSDRDIQIALMTAEQESGIRVLNNPNDPESMNRAAEGTGYDGTSTGIFQQQNNGAWGTLDDRMDPTKSAGMFYDQLEKVEGRDGMAMTAVAQKVQGSAHPDAYAKWEGKAGEELAASKKRLTELKSQASGSGGDGARVFVTNWPGGGASSFGSSAKKAIGDAEKAVGDAEEAAFIKDASIAAMFARQTGQTQLIQKESKGDGGVTVKAFANGGFHGLENHSAHIAPAGSWRVFGEPETGGEAYIPLASSKRARSRDIWLETGRRLGYGALAGAMLGGSLLTGNGLDTGWGGPSLDDLGIDKKGLQDSLQPGLNSKAEEFGMQVAAAAQVFLGDVQRNIDGTLSQVNAGNSRVRQQYARALI